VSNLDAKVGWLVNDCLTCIPNTRTLWHDLMDWFPGLEDKTNGNTPFPILANVIEDSFNRAEKKPDYIIRNGSYFPKINVDIPTIALIQDTQDNPMQTEVINSVTCIIFSSHQTYKIYKDRINPKNARVIEWASDFTFWKPIPERHPEVLPNSIIFIGDSSHGKKGFHRVLNLIETMTDFNFCLVMKDDTTLEAIPEEHRDRVRIFNKANTELVRLLMNSSVCGICTSNMEEGHWAGIELGACNVPMVSRPMGRYLDNADGTGMWGELAEDEDFPATIREVVKNKDAYSPREYYSKEYTHERFREKWTKVLEEFVV
jgi:glycosyltransferase involved in cell wall biosynthesis